MADADSTTKRAHAAIAGDEGLGNAVGRVACWQENRPVLGHYSMRVTPPPERRDARDDTGLLVDRPCRYGHDGRIEAGLDAVPARRQTLPSGTLVRIWALHTPVQESPYHAGKVTGWFSATTPPSRPLT